VPLPRQANEKQFVGKVLGCLEPWFKIEREVHGVYPFLGTYARIDAVLRPLDPTGWFDAEPTFGIEFKQLGSDTRDAMRLAAQSIDYTYVDWNGYGRIGIFMCAPDRGVFPVMGGKEDPNFNLAHLLGQFTVGELCYLRGSRKWALLMHGWHVIWSEGYGIEEGKRRSIIPKVGSR
jgi:hypothetical protein